VILNEEETTRLTMMMTHISNSTRCAIHLFVANILININVTNMEYVVIATCGKKVTVYSLSCVSINIIMLQNTSPEQLGTARGIIRNSTIRRGRSRPFLMITNP
jgi:hypothetical protein